jgi:predicted nucleic acid-binding protein
MALPENFVDTSAWYELFTRENLQHAVAIEQIWEDREYGFVTSDFVIDELFTLLRGRRLNHIAQRAWNAIQDPSVKRLSLSREDVDETFALFQKFSDKAGRSPIAPVTS